jgi:hypothetical protein
VKNVTRIILTFTVVAIEWLANAALSVNGTLTTGQMAGDQFKASDHAYIATQSVFRFYNAMNFLFILAGLVLLVVIWYKPAKAWLTMLLSAMALMILMVPQPASAYYQQTDYTENYFILPNESAFFIPDVGDNKSSQASFGSEQYLSERKIAAKRFEIPHMKLSNSGLFSNFYVPSGRLIVVDRTPVSREWVKASHRGTSAGDQSFPCQSQEGLDVTAGVAIGASVYEESAPKFLFKFGVNPPTGDRNDPNVVFTSVYRGKSLAEVMDGPVRSRIQSLVCDEMTLHPLTEDNAKLADIMGNIEKKVKAYLDSVGISLDFIGWGDTLQFSHEVQSALDRRFVASQDIEVAKAMQPYTPTLQALATAQSTRTVAEKWNGALPSSVSLWWLPSSISDWVSKALTPADKK